MTPGTNNPFAAPEVDADPIDPNRRSATSSEEGIWRRGKVLVMRKEAVLPDVCIKTGERTSGYKLDRTLYHHHPLIYLALVISPIVYIIIAAIARKKAKVALPISDATRAKRRTWIMVGWGGAVLGLVMCFVGGATNIPAVPLVGVAVMLFGIIGGIFGARLAWPSKIDDQHVYLQGVCEEFLAQFPTIP